MRNFMLVANGVDVRPLMLALNNHPELWNQHTWRTTYAGTPHADVDDIWIRYSSLDATADVNDVSKVTNDTKPVWYPALKDLPQCRQLIFDLMRVVEGFSLERVVISRIKPGGRILPHSDATGSYTDQDDGRRFHIVLQGLPGSMFRAGDEQVNMLTGQVWTFNHLVDHEVVNNSADDRIHLLVDIRTAK